MMSFEIDDWSVFQSPANFIWCVKDVCVEQEPDNDIEIGLRTTKWLYNRQSR